MEIKSLLRSLTIIVTLFSLYECNDYEDCPAPKVAECDRDLRDFYDRVNVKSPTYNKNFMCDTKTDGGGWTIIQRRYRKDGSFNKDWKNYKLGFGQVCNDYWIGNEFIYRMTSKGRWELRIDMEYNHKPYFAQYSEFYLESENSNYRMHYKKLESGNVLDMLAEHKGKQFSTPEKDNTDGHNGCARKYSAGWWYANCHSANLNGDFDDKRLGQGVIWKSLTTDFSSLDSVEMKIRVMQRK